MFDFLGKYAPEKMFPRKWPFIDGHSMKAVNSSPAIMPLAALYFWIIFLGGHISLKN
jgi:hypothetical protein